MRGKIRLLVACALAGALALPLGVAAQEAAHDMSDKAGAEQARRDKQRHEPLALDCRAFGKDGRDAVGCHWSPSKSRDFAAYRLLRFTREQREPSIVFTGADRGATKAIDETVARDTIYMYLVQAVNAAGEVVAQSHPVKVHTGSRPERPSPGIALPGVPVL